MNPVAEIVSPLRTGAGLTAKKALSRATALWFTTAAVGQLIFVYYVVVFYGGAAARGDLGAWNQILSGGYVPGDTAGNIAVAAHLFLAVVITLGGPIQLVPQIRSRFPAFHRWNGRVYVVTAFVLSLGGLFMIWTRGTVGGLSQHLGTSLNGILIMLCAAMAVRHAMARRLGVHRRWALRLFLVVSGVWFFRVFLMLWLTLWQGPVGFDPETFAGPFLTFLAFGQFVVPLAVLEVYLHARDSGGALSRLVVAGLLVVISLAMGLGIFAATFGMWLPNL